MVYSLQFKDMKQKSMIFAWMLLAMPVGMTAQTDSLGVDSVTWSKELDGVTVVHQKRPFTFTFTFRPFSVTLHPKR